MNTQTELGIGLEKGQLELVWIAADAVQRNSSNWRLHPKEQTDSLNELIFGAGGVGWAGAALVNLRFPEDGWGEGETVPTIVDGHDRQEIAIAQNQPMPALIGRWTPQEERLILQTLDPIAMLATVDAQKVQDLAKLVSSEISPNLEAALAAALGAINVEIEVGGGSGSDADIEPQWAEAEALRDKYSVELGQLWQLGNHRLLCGDCTNPQHVAFLTKGEKIDMLLTDPPYGVDYSEKNKELNALDGQYRNEQEFGNDAIGDNYQKLFGDFLRNIEFNDYNTFYIFMQGKEYAALVNALEHTEYYRAQELIWVKNAPVMGRQDYNHQHELIVYGWKDKHKFYGAVPPTLLLDEEQDIENLTKEQLIELLVQVRQTSDVIRHNKNMANDLHPTMKPVTLLGRLLRDGSDKDAVVYDPFAGSSSTLVACQNEGRRGLACEIDPRYVGVSIQRMVDLSGGVIKPEMIGVF